MAKKISTSIRLSEEAKRLLEEMAGDKGISQAAIIELAIRELAEKGGYRK